MPDGKSALSVMSYIDACKYIGVSLMLFARFLNANSVRSSSHVAD